MSDIQLGLIVGLNDNIEMEFKKLAHMGFYTCQLGCKQNEYYEPKYEIRVKNASKEYSIKITALWCSDESPEYWDFINGPITIGLVPPAYRSSRINSLIRCSDFARAIGITDIVTHAGFIPEDPNNNDFSGTVAALKYVASNFKRNGQNLLLETGQETPVTLLRAIHAVGLDNVKINYDPANLLMYGKANPIDALDLLGPYIRGVHAKDGEYPVDGISLGQEKPLGQGKVNFPALVARLKELGYTGAITIEREISGEQQTKDILSAKTMLEKLL